LSSLSPSAPDAFSGVAVPAPPLRIAVADDHPLWVRALVAMLDGAPELEVVETCSTAAEVLDRCADGIDVLVLDYQMPPGTALDVLAGLRRLGAIARVVVLSAFTEEMMVRSVIEAGATGYLSKTETLDDLPELLTRVAQGHTVLSDEARAALASTAARPELSVRERQVLDLAAAGLTDEAIARRLGVSRHTIRTYLTRLFGKLGAANRAEAVALAARGDVLPMGPGA
jgi:DNA-binding NarL/FixJ family response regulator